MTHIVRKRCCLRCVCHNGRKQGENVGGSLQCCDLPAQEDWLRQSCYRQENRVTCLLLTLIFNQILKIWNAESVSKSFFVQLLSRFYLKWKTRHLKDLKRYDALQMSFRYSCPLPVEELVHHVSHIHNTGSYGNPKDKTTVVILFNYSIFTRSTKLVNKLWLIDIKLFLLWDNYALILSTRSQITASSESLPPLKIYQMLLLASLNLFSLLP